MSKKEYRTVVVGTDGSPLAATTVARAAWLAAHEDADLVIVCAYAESTRRAEAKNVATIAGDTRLAQVVLGRDAASQALGAAVAGAGEAGATIAAALLVEGEPAAALLEVAEQRNAGLIVLGAIADRTIVDRLLGTVAEEVAKSARCDVLIVRPAAPAAVAAPSADAAEPATHAG